MQYYVDGYNLMFRSSTNDDDFSANRQKIIKALNRKAGALNVNMILVFDARWVQNHEEFKAHFQHLEIIFTAYGETADEWLLKKIRESSNPQNIALVTSDRQLALSAKPYAIKIETIDQFLGWLNKRYFKKQHQKKEVIAPPKETEAPKGSKPKTSFDYYLEAFQKDAEDIQLPKSKKTKLIKKEKPLTDHERWLKAFERDEQDD